MNDTEELSAQTTHCYQCGSVLTEHEMESNNGWWCDACERPMEDYFRERERRETHREEVVGYAQVTGAEKLAFFACTIPFRDAWTGVDFVTITRGEWENPTSLFYHALCEICRHVHR